MDEKASIEKKKGGENQKQSLNCFCDLSFAVIAKEVIFGS